MSNEEATDDTRRLMQVIRATQEAGRDAVRIWSLNPWAHECLDAAEKGNPEMATETIYRQDVDKLIEEAEERYGRAANEIDRLTSGAGPSVNWRWSIPAKPDRDSDLILSASIEDVPKLIEALRVSREREKELETELAKVDDMLKGSGF
jgi:hypothetical protein